MKQNGVALLTVLLVVAIVTIIAMQMTQRLTYNAQRTINIAQSQHAYWYAMGAEAFAKRALMEQVKQADGIIHLNQPWAEEDINYPVNNGNIEAKVKDLSACFNLNALYSKDNQPGQSQGQQKPVRDGFNRLLKLLVDEDGNAIIDDYDADVVADSLVDWLDEDDRPYGFYGVESSEYESKLPPYRSADAPMVTRSELRLVNGVQPQWVNTLMDYVCVIPDQTELQLNVNTLNEEVGGTLLAAVVGESLDVNAAKNLLSKRPQDGYEDINDFFAEPEIAALNLSEEKKRWFSVTTQYFLLTSKTRYNEAQFTMTSLLKFDSASQVRVIRREYGGPF